MAQILIVEYGPWGVSGHGCGMRKRCNRAELEIRHIDNLSCDLSHFPRPHEGNSQHKQFIDYQPQHTMHGALMP